MNHIHRIVWNRRLGAWVAAAETARGRGKGGGLRASAASATLVLLSHLFTCAMAAAQGVPSAVVASGNTKAYVTPNGVTVVDIATANAAGLSHNKYLQYNVNPSGLVLNNGNSSELARQSQLAGQVAANFNLTQQAKVILNEVVSNNRSMLAGFTEVLGGRADVVLANPYGITCSGCGFINTDRVTLTTGLPSLDASGGLSRFSVQQGDVLVTGHGLNATAQQVLDIVTRSIKVDADIHANDLGISAGSNDWDYGTRLAKPGAAAAAPGAPVYAIDSGALGGMYANRIRLTSTEQGVGVRMLGDAAASAGDFTLTASGAIEVQSRISAQKNLHLETSSAAAAAVQLSNASLTSAQDTAILATAGTVALNGSALIAGNNLKVSASSLADTASAAAIANNNRRHAGGTLQLAAAHAASLNGTVWDAGGAWQGDFGSLSLAGQTRLAAGTSLAATASSGALDLGTAAVLAHDHLSLSASGAISTAAAAGQGVESAAGSVSLRANGLNNAGNINAAGGGVTLRVNGSLDNSGQIYAGTALDIADQAGTGTQALNNSGSLLGDTVALKAGHAALANNASVSSVKDMSLDVASLTLAGSDAQITGARSGAGSVALHVAQALSNSGLVYSGGSLDIHAATLTSNGSLIAQNNLAATTSGGVNLQGSALIAGNNLTVSAASLTDTASVAATQNNNRRRAGGALQLTVDGAANIHASTWDSGGAWSGSFGTLALSGQTRLAGGSSLTASTGAGDLALGGAAVTANTDLVLLASHGDISTASAAGQGVQSAAGQVHMTAATISNAGNVKADAGDVILRTSGLLNNSGKIQAGAALDMADRTGGATQNITNSGTLAGDTVLMNARNFQLANDAALSSAKNMAVTLNSLDMGGSGSKIIAASSTQGDANITIATAFTNKGVVFSGNNLALRAPDVVNTGTGAIAARNNLTLHATSGALRNNGSLYAGNTLAASAATTLSNLTGGATDVGTINADAAVVLQAQTVVNNSDIVSRDITISANTIRNEITGGDTRVWGAEGPKTQVLTHHEGKGYKTGRPNDEIGFNFNDVNHYQWWNYTDTWSQDQTYSGGTPAFRPQIIGSGVINLNFVTGNNLGGVISAATLNLQGTAPGATFTNDDLTLQRRNFRNDYRHFIEYKAAGPAKWIDNPRHINNTAMTLETISSIGAGVFATTLNAGGFALVNAGSPYTTAPTPTGAPAAPGAVPGAGGTPVAPGPYSVPAGNPAANFGSFPALPSNPNGVFVMARNPASKYLVESNPLYTSASNAFGSDYLARLLGFNLDTLQKRLGDASYEAYLVRQQLIAQTGNAVLAGYNSADAQMEGLMQNALAELQRLEAAGSAAGVARTARDETAFAGVAPAAVASKAALQTALPVKSQPGKSAASSASAFEFGKALTPAQQSLLKRDIVWMVETVVGGQKVLAPVVYLAQKTKDTLTTGAVISASTADLNLSSLTNTGGTIIGSKSIKIASLGDITNLSGLIKGGDVSLKSSTGSIVNETVASGSGGGKLFRTTIGKTAGIESTGALNLDAKQDIINKGATVAAGGDASLKAGGNVIFDTVENKNTDTTTSDYSFGGVKGDTISTTTTVQQVKSGLSVGGNLDMNAGKDITLAGTDAKIAGNADLTAGGSLNIIARENTTTTSTESKASGMGMGGAAYGSTKTNTESLSVRNVGSAFDVGGNASLAAKNDITVQGSSVDVAGSGNLSATNVNVLAGRNYDETTTKTTTKSYLKPVGSNQAGGDLTKAGAKGAASGKASAGATSGDLRGQANAQADGQATGQASGGLALATTTTAQSKTTDLKNVASTLNFGKDLAITASKDITLKGSNVAAAGSVTTNSENLNILAVEDKATSSTKTSTTSVGFMASTDNKVAASAGAKGAGTVGAGVPNASGNLNAGAQASTENKVALFEQTKTERNSLDIVNQGASIKSGGDMKLNVANQLTVAGSDVAAGHNLDLNAKDMNFVAVNDVHETSSSSSKTSFGLYATGSVSATGKADASVGVGGQAATSASVSAKAGAGVYGTNTKAGESERATTAKTSGISAGGSISRTAAEGITDVGTRIEAGGDLNQSARTISSLAAENTSSASASSSTNSARVGVYADMTAKASASQGATGGSSETGIKPSAGADLSVRHDSRASSSSSSDAVVSTIKVGGSVNSKSTGATKLVGTSIDAGNSVTLGAQTLDYQAAANTTASSASNKTVDVGAKVDVVNKNATVAVGGLGGSSKSKSSTAVAGGIRAGGGVNLQTSGDMRLEGTQIASAGPTAVEAGGNLTLDAAKNTAQSSSKSANANLSVTVGRGSSKGEGALGYKQASSNSSQDVGASIQSGSSLNLASGGDTTLTGTTLVAKGPVDVAAGGNLTVAAAVDTSHSSGMNVSASAAGGAGKSSADGKETTSKRGEAAIAGGFSKTDKRTERGASISSESGSVSFSSGKSTTLVGTQVSAADGISVDAGGAFTQKDAVSTSRTVGFQGSASAEGSSKDTRQAKPADKPPTTTTPAGFVRPTPPPGSSKPMPTTAPPPVPVSESNGSGVLQLTVDNKKTSVRQETKLDGGQGGVSITTGANAGKPQVSGRIPVPANMPAGMTLKATAAGGKPLPAWLKFDAGTGTFTGTPPADFKGDLKIDVSIPQADGSLKVQSMHFGQAAAANGKTGPAR